MAPSNQFANRSARQKAVLIRQRSQRPIAGFAIVPSVAMVWALSAAPCHAETLSQALARAYSSNPQINQQRANLRAADESLPIARAGFLPSVNGQITGSSSTSDGNSSQSATAGITVNQRLFNGFRTVNSIRQVDAGIRASRAGLANAELSILRAGAVAYINVLRDGELLSLQKANRAFLDEQVRAAQARFDVGEGTRTDIATAQAQQAAALAQISAAQATLRVSQAQYRQIIGAAPANLKTPRVPAHLMPNSLQSARGIALNRHPAIRAQQFAADSEAFGVKIAEGALLPTLDVQGALSTTANSGFAPSANTASVSATLTIPLFAGGRNYASVRQSKQRLAAQRIGVDEVRDQIRANVDEAWAQLTAARSVVSASQSQLEAGRLALKGVVEERNVGQRTTLDVLQAQRTVNEARIGLAEASANQRAASYAIIAATGRLTARALGLGVSYYDDRAHYELVKDKWFDLRTPSAR
ncbi:MAG: TolC family outer membrane protein [Pseudomonadota bacterium]